MKTKLHSRKLLTPLAGSICALLAITTLTPLINGAHSSAAEAVPKNVPTKTKASAEPVGESKNSNALSPEDSLATGLKYLLDQQHADGGWGQGGGWRQSTSQDSRGGRVEGSNVEDPSDLGNTCASVVTLLRAAQSPTQGEHRKAMAKAFDFICRQVENADHDSLYVTDVRDTQLQVKIGTYVDTFLAGWALSELKGKVADEAAEKRRSTALDKVVAKIEHNQRDDGSFAGNNGWAAVISQGLCSKSLNLAARSGAKVSRGALDNAQKQNAGSLDLAKGDFTAPASPTAEPTSAGVSLYREAAKLNGLLENSRSNVARKEAAEKVAKDTQAPAPARAKAESELKQIDADDKAADVARKAVAGKVGIGSYMAGFGNNGGEEFISYMNIAESMREHGGKEWDEWRGKMTKTVCGAQNGDGSWAGQHCITGRTFCTATALLTLLVGQENDNARLGGTNPSATPVAAK